MGPELALTPEMMAVLGLLGLTIFLFVSEIVPVDLAALIVMVILGLSGMVGGDQLFAGFSSNAVISIIAVMIIGAGLDKTGIMTRLAGFILKLGGHTEARIIAFISGTVGVISSFMQNVGAAALFLPVVTRISRRTALPLSRLLMPMGFCAILGGTITLVGSSPLILLNDLLLTSNQHLPPGAEPMRTFSLFDVTPVGLALLAAGIAYFVLLGRWVLPSTKGQDTSPGTTLEYFQQTYGLQGDVYEVEVPAGSPLIGRTTRQIEAVYPQLFVLGLRSAQTLRLAPPGDEAVPAGATLAVMGRAHDVGAFVQGNDLVLRPQVTDFADILSPVHAGIAQAIVPPSSELAGRTLGELRMRQRYGTSVLALHRGEQVWLGRLLDHRLQVGDILVLHGTWEQVAVLDADKDFVVITDYPHEEMRPHKAGAALLFFAVALGLVLLTDFRLSVALLTGAVGMIVSGVLRMEEAYRAVSWKTVFLLASLIPLGIAVETTGTAAWIAQGTLNLLQGVPSWVLQAAIAVLATAFTLVMSNVGATVLLVPLAVNIAIGAGADPRVFALTVALTTSNSFIIPTHQVNALIMGPAGYRVKDFMRAGSIMTLLFLAIMLVMLNLVFD